MYKYKFMHLELVLDFTMLVRGGDGDVFPVNVTTTEKLLPLISGKFLPPFLFNFCILKIFKAWITAH